MDPHQKLRNKEGRPFGQRLWALGAQLPSIVALAWGVLGAIACAAVAVLEPNLVEEGLVVHVAQRMVAGEQIYRDIIFFSAPLPFELLAILFRIFGEEVAVGRYAMVAIHGISTGLIYAFVRRAKTGPFAHTAAALIATVPITLFPLFSIFWYTTIAYYLGLIAVYVALRGTHSGRWAIAAGVLVSCVALCKQTVGAVLALGLLTALTACSPPGRRLAHARAMILGGAGAAVTTLLLFALRGNLAELVRCLVIIPLSIGETYSSPYINLWPPGVLDPQLLANKALYIPNIFFLAYGIFTQVGMKTVLLTQFLYALPLSTLIATAVARLTGPLPSGVWLNGALLFAMSTNLFPRSDWGHLVFALPPAVLQVLLLVRSSRRKRGERGWAALAVAGGLSLLIFAGTFWVGRAIHGLAIPSYWGPRIPQRPVSQIYRLVSIPRVIHYLRAKVNPKEPIFVARSEPLLYFATDTTNPTPFGGVLPVLHEEQERAILAALPKVRFVVMSDIDQPAYTYYSDELPRVQADLERHFRVPPDFPLDDASWIIVLAPGPDRGPTAIDLLEARPAAMEWIRDIRGIQKVVTEAPPHVAARQNRRPLVVTLGPLGGGIDFELELPPNAVFQGDVGFRGLVSVADFHIHPEQATLVLSIGREGEFRKLHSVRIDDSERAGRRWTPVRVDLTPYGGQRVTLRLEAVPDALFGADTFTWWGSPRIALPPDPR